MRIILKFILKNIAEKKLRTFLILFSITISSALFFASSAISGTMEKMFLEQQRKYIGTADILIYSGKESPSPYFSSSRAADSGKRSSYIVGTFEATGYYKAGKDNGISMRLQGSRLEDLQSMNPFTLQQQYQLQPFEGRKIIISQHTAQTNHLKAGERMNVDINGFSYSFTIAGIAYPSGPFKEDGQTTYGVVPYEWLSRIYHAQGRYTNLYIQAEDAADKAPLLKDLTQAYPRYTVKEAVSQDEFQNFMGSITTTFMLMVMVVFFMSMFIIYTSFKLITTERLPIIGTFRSVGATRGTTSRVMLLESLVYGSIGGALGCLLGIGILYLMSMATASPWSQGMQATVQFSSVQLLMAFLSALVLSLGSSLLPILRISRIPIKDIVLNKIEKTKEKKNWQLILGLFFLAFAVFAPRLVPKGAAMIVDTVCLLLSAVTVVLLVPYFTNLLVRIFEKLYALIFGNEGILAAKNLQDNKSLLNNITLLAIGLSSLLMINTVSFSVVTEVANVFSQNTHFDIMAVIPSADRNTEQRILTIDGVKSVYGIYQANNIQAVDYQYGIQLVQGVNKAKYLDYWNMAIPGDRKAVLEQLDTGRNILLTPFLRDKFGVQVGDSISLDMASGVKSYRVAGFFPSIMQNGSFALIPERYFKVDMQQPYYSEFEVKTSKEPSEVAEEIKRTFSRRQPHILTLTELKKMNDQSNAQIFGILQGFSIMTMIIGIFGVLNNLFISFIERKRSLAMLRSMGMSKGQMIKMIFVEALTGGFIGGIIGIGAALQLISMIPYVMKAIDMPIPVHYSLTLFIQAMIAGALIMLVASISPALKSSRLHIIESIKYE